MLCARRRPGALTWVFRRPRQRAGARHLHAPNPEIRLLLRRAAPLPLRRKLPPRFPAPPWLLPWLPRSAALDSVRLPPSAGGLVGPREAALPAQALSALAGYPTLNLLAPPGGRGWRQVIGAGGSPERIPNPPGGLLFSVVMDPLEWWSRKISHSALQPFSPRNEEPSSRGSPGIIQ